MKIVYFKRGIYDNYQYESEYVGYSNSDRLIEFLKKSYELNNKGDVIEVHSMDYNEFETITSSVLESDLSIYEASIYINYNKYKDVLLYLHKNNSALEVKNYIKKVFKDVDGLGVDVKVYKLKDLDKEFEGLL